MGLLLLSLGLGFVAHQEGWHRVILRSVMHPRETVDSWSQRATLPVLQIDLPFEEYQRLLHQREQARQLGFYPPRPQDIASATLTYGEEEERLEVEMHWRVGECSSQSESAWYLEATVLEEPGREDLLRLALSPAEEDYLLDWGARATLRHDGGAEMDSLLVG